MKLVIPDHILSRSVGEDTVLLDLKRDEYFSLDSVGTQVWARLAQGQTLGAIVESISGDYGMETERVEHDVRQLVDSLMTSGLLGAP